MAKAAAASAWAVAAGRVVVAAVVADAVAGVAAAVAAPSGDTNLGMLAMIVNWVVQSGWLLLGGDAFRVLRLAIPQQQFDVRRPR